MVALEAKDNFSPSQPISYEDCEKKPLVARRSQSMSRDGWLLGKTSHEELKERAFKKDVMDVLSHLWYLTRLIFAFLCFCLAFHFWYRWQFAPMAFAPLPKPDCGDTDWAQRRACRDSLGHLLMNDETWDIKRDAHEARVKQRDHLWSTMIDQVVSEEMTLTGGGYWSKFWLPTFTCPFEKCFGGCEHVSRDGSNRGAWVCDPVNVRRMYQFPKTQCIIYTFGTDPTFSFEHAAEKMFKRCTIHAFYPQQLSTSILNKLPGYIHYHPFGLSGHEKEVNGVKYMPLQALMKRFHHQGAQLEVLKLDDCEGCNIDGLADALKGVFVRQVLFSPRRIPIGKVEEGAGEWAPGGFHLSQVSSLVQLMTNQLGYVIFHSDFNLATSSAQVSLIRFAPSFSEHKEKAAAPSGLLQAASVGHRKGDGMAEIKHEAHALLSKAQTSTRTLASFWESRKDLARRANPLAPSGFGNSVRYNGNVGKFSLRHDDRFEMFEERLESLVRSAGIKLFQRIEYEPDSHGLGQSAISLLEKFGPTTGWLQLPLMSSDGQIDNLKPCMPQCKPTEAWKFLPAENALHDLMTPLMPAVRQMRLSNIFPGEIITYHSDEVTGCRCHVPITSLKDAHIRIGMQTTPEWPGAAFCGDFSFPHVLYNKGNTVRTHLFFDVDIKGQENSMILKESKFGRGVLNACRQIFNQPNRLKALVRATALLEEYKSVFMDVESEAQAEKYGIQMSPL